MISLNSNQSLLPIELLEHIIDNVDISSPDGKQSLITCSYANSTLRVLCQTRIFQDVAVIHGLQYATGESFFDDEQSTGNKFLSLLDRSPHIGSYVRNFTLKAVMLDWQREQSDTICSKDPGFSLYATRPHLQKLQKFTVVAPVFLLWSRFDQRMKSFFHNSIAQVLPEVDFHIIRQVPISVFYNCAALQDLRISHLKSESINTTSSLHTKAKLRVLQVGRESFSSALGRLQECFKLFEPPSSPFDLSQLTELILPDYGYSVADIQFMLGLCSKSLERLDLRLDNHYGTVTLLEFEPVICTDHFAPSTLDPHMLPSIVEAETISPNLGSLHKLRRLAFRATISCLEGRVTSNIPLASVILKTIPNDGPLSEVVLNTLLQNYSVDNLAVFPWSTVVDVLCGNRVWPHLTRVELKFEQMTNIRTVRISPANLADSLDRNDDLNKLRERGLLLYI
ncbi:hypothetical protein GALMADRAFT_239026 [Galerina marginata CBS 339.88]|uniref:F-box domain-containing protein n=1 Tax=Galerina marginata (strain CBS 339.88) TaxID=685588 RepID=A0A067TW04_GALM3|nr:hypothetical protein GALMADRAFT_239026 [Galerina marginata CBS 339.88]